MYNQLLLSLAVSYCCNGFNKDGNYNREISEIQQLNSSNTSACSIRRDISGDVSGLALSQPRYGFCNECNEAQRLKVEKLAQFELKYESHFDEELKAFRIKLEEQYRLCRS
ncbi:unnamed protein product [Ceratitis capitata]|uniref:(Mediterranean fruit fly) hypothetical protein n=1 Tax=Ceratitis capitata TaxID=7213 RepID=A0A811US15_CERCA|nr:unnamed protein product [Ceratitis capitata]CAD7001501.1 unnamed protein product [Ceratitis capitata]